MKAKAVSRRSPGDDAVDPPLNDPSPITRPINSRTATMALRLPRTAP